ncbi:MAG: hypothetical protein Q4F75_00700 [Pseudomonadota bacterium]|nr:hypothetical protein [Pseudomonadota bacterium]
MITAVYAVVNAWALCLVFCVSACACWAFFQAEEAVPDDSKAAGEFVAAAVRHNCNDKTAAG